MPLKELQQKAIIKNESGIVSKKGKGFHTPAAFALENLLYIIWSDEYICNEHYRVQRSYLDSLVLFHIVYGEMEFQYQGKSFTAIDGDDIFLDLRYPHTYKATTQTRVQQYMIGGAAAQKYYELLYSHYGPILQNKRRTSVLFSRLQSELNTPFPNDHQVAALLQQIFSTLVVQNQPCISSTVLKAQEYIISHFQHPISVDDIAASVSLSRYHFTRVFKKETGYSPHEYLSNIRIRHAKQLLIETSATVEQIAFQSGFSSATHFTRMFKQKNMITPVDFRKFFDPIGFQ